MEFPNNSFAFGSNVAPTSSVMMQGLPPSFGNTMYQSVHSHVPNYHFTSTPATNSIYESSSQSLPFDVSAPASQSARRSSSNGDSQSAKDVKKPKRKQVKNACGMIYEFYARVVQTPLASGNSALYTKHAVYFSELPKGMQEMR